MINGRTLTEILVLQGLVGCGSDQVKSYNDMTSINTADSNENIMQDNSAWVFRVYFAIGKLTNLTPIMCKFRQYF